MSPFELASAYKIWKASNATQHERIERIAQGKGRRKSLFQLGNSLKPALPQETKPADFDEEYWIRAVKDYLRKVRAGDVAKERARNKGGKIPRRRPRGRIRTPFVRPFTGGRRSIFTRRGRRSNRSNRIS